MRPCIFCMSGYAADLDRGAAQFSEVVTGRRLTPVHPGEILRDEFLKPMGISVYALSEMLEVSRARLNDLVRGRRAVTTDTALRLGRYFGTTPEFSINLLDRYELDGCDALRARIEREITPRAA